MLLKVSRLLDRNVPICFLVHPASAYFSGSTDKNIIGFLQRYNSEFKESDTSETIGYFVQGFVLVVTNLPAELEGRYRLLLTYRYCPKVTNQTSPAMYLASSTYWTTQSPMICLYCNNYDTRYETGI